MPKCIHSIARRRALSTFSGLTKFSAVLLPLLGLGLAQPAAAQTTERVSVATGGSEANVESFIPAISTDGRFVAFSSRASNLVPGDTNSKYDAFVRDRQTGVTERVSVASDGTQGNGNSSTRSSFSADGRYVAFSSSATNLVPGATNNAFDVFVRDRQTGVTERVSVATGGTEANGGSSAGIDVWISADGRYVAFSSRASNLVPGNTNSKYDAFVRDRQTGVTERVSVATGGGQANQGSFEPAISSDGRFVAFSSLSSNLVDRDTNNTPDVFVHDFQTGVTERVSVATHGTEANGTASRGQSISADGRFVAFFSDASNLVSGDTNNTFDAFVRDSQAGVTERVSVATGGGEANADTFF